MKKLIIGLYLAVFFSLYMATAICMLLKDCQMFSILGIVSAVWLFLGFLAVCIAYSK